MDDQLNFEFSAVEVAGMYLLEKAKRSPLTLVALQGARVWFNRAVAAQSEIMQRGLLSAARRRIEAAQRQFETERPWSFRATAEMYYEIREEWRRC